MKQLIGLMGLPGSGKTHWAWQYCYDHDGFVSVSKDSIRAELRLTGWQWSKVKEKWDVIPERDRQIRQYLRNGYSVISDDTNLTTCHMNGLAMIASLEGAEFKIQSFLHVPIDECIARDAARESPVGEARIREMARYTTALPDWVP